jgi:hypothetical protein
VAARHGRGDYEGADHGVIFDPQAAGDATARVIRFLRRYLR